MLARLAAIRSVDFLPVAASRTGLPVFFAVLLSCLFAWPTRAQVTPPGLFRAYLASDGSDSSPCTLPQPCRLLPKALSVVADGGEIWMLDSANFNTGTVDIQKSVSILAVPGAVGSIVATSGPAIFVEGALTVSLRNVVIAPLIGATATDGVYAWGGFATLTIDNSLLARLPGNAIRMVGQSKLRVINTLIRDNGGYAVHVGNGAQADMVNVRMLGNANGGVNLEYDSEGLISGPQLLANITDATISGGQYGVRIFAGNSSYSAFAYLDRVSITGTSAAGLSTFGAPGALTPNVGVVLNQSRITRNFKACELQSSTQVRSLGNNAVLDNINECGLPTVAPR